MGAVSQLGTATKGSSSLGGLNKTSLHSSRSPRPCAGKSGASPPPPPSGRVPRTFSSSPAPPIGRTTRTADRRSPPCAVWLHAVGQLSPRSALMIDIRDLSEVRHGGDRRTWRVSNDHRNQPTVNLDGSDQVRSRSAVIKVVPFFQASESRSGDDCVGGLRCPPVTGDLSSDLTGIGDQPQWWWPSDEA